MTLFLTVLIVAGALAFDFINGFHDTANAIATSVSTKALKPRHAIILAAVMNFFGAVIFSGVAETITKDIIDPFHMKNGSIIVLAALISAIFWNLATWYFAIPSSSSHAIIGSIAGAGIAAAGAGALNYEGFIKVLEGLLFSPLIAFGIGYIIYTLIKQIFKRRPLSKTNRQFRAVQVLTAAIQAFSHGTNDAQKSMGIITMALIANHFHDTAKIPLWVQVSCALAMGLGTYIGGWRIIKTVGGRIMKIRPANGVAADLSSAIVIFGATALKLPVSTTHVISSSIMGVGTSERIRGVRWGTARNMIATWIITLPITAIIAAILYFILNLFG